MVAGAAAFNAWALYGGWFYRDDYALLVRGHAEGLSLEYLLRPQDARLMPGTRFVAWVVATNGMSWTLAATITLALKLLAAASAVWMLLTLFGARWPVLGLLALYLTTAITVPAMTWWTASINQTPVQIAFFVAVGAWVGYLRTGSWRWLFVTVAAVAFGLLFFAKTIMVVAVLGYLALAYFASGNLLSRLAAVARRCWPAALMAGVVIGGYLAYASQRVVAQTFRGTSWELAWDVAEAMLGRAFPAGILGGPWGWVTFEPPGSAAAPPGWMVPLAWAVLVLVAGYAHLTRVRSLRAWALLAGYLAGLLLLVVFSRSGQFGAVVGLEYRYLTDAACAVVLCVGLAFLPLRGAVECSAPRERPLLTIELSPRLWVWLTVAVSVSGVVNSATFVRHWNSGNLGAFWMQTFRGDLNRRDEVDLVDGPAPDGVIPVFFAPDHRLSAIAPLLSDGVRFPQWSADLAMVANDGSLRTARIQPALVRERQDAWCGWRVTSDGTTIRFRKSTFDWTWWLRIGYVSSADAAVRVSAAGDQVDAEVEQGPHSLYVQVTGEVDSVRLDGLPGGITLCVDTVQVGDVEPGARL
jgi:hypothetical protein